jgi:DNA-binding transcriptional LysR family regulator
MDGFLRRGLKLGHLRLLAEVARAGQIGLAAARLGISQPAASRLLAEVEQIAGAPLHLRTGRGVQLTPAGTALAARAGRVLADLRDAEAEVAAIARGLGGHVRLGSVTGPALDRVLPALREVRGALPEVTVEVTVAPSDRLCAQVAEGRLDLALGRIAPGAGEGLAFAPLAAEPVVLLVRRGHPLLSQGAIRPADLFAHDWVLPGEEAILARAVRARLAALGLPMPRRQVFTASFLLTLALVQESDAIAPLARAVADVFARGAEAAFAPLPLDLGLEVEPFGLITRAGAALPPAAARLAAMVAGAASDGVPGAADGPGAAGLSPSGRNGQAPSP